RDQRRDARRLQVAAGACGHVVHHDRQRAVFGQRPVMCQQAGLGRAHVRWGHHQRRIRTQGGGATGLLDGLRRGRMPGPGQHRHPPAHGLDRGAQQGVEFDLQQRGGLAGRTGDHHALRACLALRVQQPPPGVEVEFARHRERRRQRGDAAGKSQGPGSRAKRLESGAERMFRMPACYLRPGSTGKYAGSRTRPCPGRRSSPISYGTFAADAALTDPDNASRPSPNENHLLINAYTTHPASPLLAVSRRIADSGCNLVDTRLSTVGRDVSVTALATGSWDSVAKLEAMLTRLEREEDLKLVWYRTGPKPVQSNLLPYIVEVVAADKPGILFQLADFFDRQGITIESLHCSRYRAM